MEKVMNWEEAKRLAYSGVRIQGANWKTTGYGDETTYIVAKEGVLHLVDTHNAYFDTLFIPESTLAEEEWIEYVE